MTITLREIGREKHFDLKMRFCRAGKREAYVSQRSREFDCVPATPQRRMAVSCPLSSLRWFLYPTFGLEGAEKEPIRHILVTLPKRWPMSRAILLFMLSFPLKLHKLLNIYPLFSGSSPPRNRTRNRARVSGIAGRFFTSLATRYSSASLVPQLVKNPPAMWESWVQSLGWEDPLEKGTATHSRILAWRIPWTVHGVAKSQTWLSDFHFHKLS